MTFTALPTNFERALAEVKADREVIKKQRDENARLREELNKEQELRRFQAQVNGDLSEQLAAAQAEAVRLKGILRDTALPHCYRIQISKGDYHYRKMVNPEELVFVEEIVKEMISAIDDAMKEKIE